MLFDSDDPYDMVSHRSEIELDEKLPSFYSITEGGPLEGIQVGEKMWILFDAKTPPYYDVQFKVFGMKAFFHYLK